nr:MAG TPA: hypothetical protein [Caudoviricetes sp.]
MPPECKVFLNNCQLLLTVCSCVHKYNVMAL